MGRREQWRLYLFLGAVFFLFGTVCWRLFSVSYLKHSWYAQTAEAQITNTTSILLRGNIYVTDKAGTANLAATTAKFPVVEVVASRVPRSEDRAVLAKRIADISSNDEAAVLRALNASGDIARTLPRRLNTAQVDAIKALNVTGIGTSYIQDRTYPLGSLAADVIGFLGYDGDQRKGQYGIESLFDAELSGHKDFIASWASPGSLISTVRHLFTKQEQNPSPTPLPDRPEDVILTVDANVQAFVQQALRDVITKYQADRGTVIVQEPTTGRILAMADWPTFDPNAYGQTKPETFLNSSVQQIFEPGSSFKPFTMSAGLDSHTVTPETTYTDVGYVDVAGKRIQNYDGLAHGVKTMTQVLEKSLNTGVMFVENKVGDETFLNYVVDLGFGQPTGIDLPGEVSGDISNLYSGRKINFLTASFGQGIAVTPLQLITAYSAIANGGKLMRPYVVDRIVSEGGLEQVTEPRVIGTPFTEKTASLLRQMLTSVVDIGFDKARIKGYDVAGKTGTAQIPDGRGGYLEDEYIHDFVGFAPSNDPRFVIFLKMERPKGITFASDSLSPTFRDITAFLLNYLSVAPTRPQ